MPKIDIASIAQRVGSNCPAPFHEPIAERTRKRLGDAGGLTRFGVNLLHLPPGCWSSQRHWHSEEDEFVFIVSGEVVLVTNAGEEVLRTGECAAFPANEANGHHLINRSDAIAVCLEVGSRSASDRIVYSDIDMVFDPIVDAYVQRDGTKYPVRP